jgi:hypothetical protein
MTAYSVMTVTEVKAITDASFHIVGKHTLSRKPYTWTSLEQQLISHNASIIIENSFRPEQRCVDK